MKPLHARRWHELKTHREWFALQWNGAKPFELRQNDRDFQVGDLLLLVEWDGERYTGRSVVSLVLSVVGGAWLKPGNVALGLSQLVRIEGTHLSEAAPPPVGDELGDTLPSAMLQRLLNLAQVTL